MHIFFCYHWEHADSSYTKFKIRMENIDDLIQYEHENTRLDFKREEYIKDNYPSFLKDVIAMANAITNDDKFIIIGLKPKSSDDRGFKGIEAQLTDSATLQQLVHENIEPELSIDYFPYKFKEYKLGILRISNCNNPPYLMKKDYGNGNNKLHKGDGFIRKGSHQTRLSRTDIDHYIKSKIEDKYFNAEVDFTLETLNCTNEIELIDLEKIKRPSQIQKEKIENILANKKAKETQLKKLGITPPPIYIGSQMTYFNSIITGEGIPYEERDINTLERNLLDVEENYLKYDYYEFFEKQVNKCNISILNKGDKYIEDATLILKIPKIEGLWVLDKIYQEPNENSLGGYTELSQTHYPEVNEEENFFLVKGSVGDIKHQILTSAFDENLRVFASTRMNVDTFKITCEMYGKNIRTSIKKEIDIKTRNKEVTYDK